MKDALRASTRFDLHLHSNRSDGRFSAEEVLEHAVAGGLEVIALTDHDLSTPMPPGIHQIQGRPLLLLGGAEISGVHEDHELHLLVYFPGQIPEGFRAFCRAQCRERAQRYAEAVRRIGLRGLPLPGPRARSGEIALTRLHLAQALVEAKHAESTSDAFRRYLSDARGIVPHLSTMFTEGIRLARSFGGITSWAHPPLPAVEAYLGTFAAAGLQGLEAIRPGMKSTDRRRLRRHARQHGLFLTGGSDWHGWSRHDLGLFQVQAHEIRGFVDVLSAAVELI
ncbi:MAG TPA: PHP domain-containing protein [Deltaproteobacteria bacterium]|nr:PHP domain-containing protein [Deltaproteobacteria bacterium]